MKLISPNSDFKEGLAQIISLMVQPLIMTILVFVIFNYFSTNKNDFFMLTLLCLLFATFLPLTTILMWIKRNKLDLDVSNRDKRTFPLLLGIISYLIGVTILFIVGAPDIVIVLMFCYLTSTMLTLLITFFWKISVHAMGVAGPTAAITFVFGYPGLLLMFPLIMVMWSRIYLKKHTPAQVIIGAVTSLIVTWTQFNILLGLNII